MRPAGEASGRWENTAGGQGKPSHVGEDRPGEKGAESSRTPGFFFLFSRVKKKLGALRTGTLETQANTVLDCHRSRDFLEPEGDLQKQSGI